MKLTITHHPAPEQQGIPASEAPEGVPLRVVVSRFSDLMPDTWCLRHGHKLYAIGKRGVGTVEFYRVIPLAPGESITIAREAERSEA